MPSAVQRQDGSWLIDGMMPVDEFKDSVSDRTSHGRGGTPVSDCSRLCHYEVGAHPYVGGAF